MKLKVRNNEGGEHLFSLINMHCSLPVMGEVYLLVDFKINRFQLRVYAGEELIGPWYRIEFETCAEDFARWYVRNIFINAYITIDHHTIAVSRTGCVSYSVVAGQFISRGCTTKEEAWNNVANKIFAEINDGIPLYDFYEDNLFQCELDTSTECDLSDQ